MLMVNNEEREEISIRFAQRESLGKYTPDFILLCYLSVPDLLRSVFVVKASMVSCPTINPMKTL